MDVDTIVSLSTAPGVGAVALVRLSGPAAGTILEALAGPGSAGMDPRTARLAELTDPDDGAPLDRALVTRFVAPASYTGEHMVEISCHGGWLVPGLVVDACIRAGARQAEPGEFTRRAYLHGKMDLVQVEAVADLIEARSRVLHRAAIGQLDRGLSRRVSDMRERLVRVEALLAHHLDFPEEDDAPVPLTDVVAEAERLTGELDRMLATAPEGELLREGALVVFAGRPNAGKSSLYNALLGQERAIVTEEPGTTRDALEAVVQLGGYPFRMVDTAGLRESEQRIERLGIEIARRYIDGADVILFCVPVDEAITEGELAFLAESRSAPLVVVETKADRVRATEATGDRPGGAVMEEPAGAVRVSVETGEGLDALQDLLPRLAYASVIAAAADDPVLTRKRHAKALGRAREEVHAFRAGLLDGLPAEVASTHLRAAETALEELLGTISVDDVLDVVFREFCIGK